HAPRAYAPGPEGGATARIPLGWEEDGRGPIQLVHPVLVTREAESEAIAAERVGRPDPGTGVEVAAMDCPYDVRVRKVPDLGGVAELEPGLEEHRAHGPIREDRASRVEQLGQAVGHASSPMGRMVRDAHDRPAKRHRPTSRPGGSHLPRSDWEHALRWGDAPSRYWAGIHFDQIASFSATHLAAASSGVMPWLSMSSAIVLWSRF